MKIRRARWACVLLSALVATPCAAQSYSDLVLADNPIAYWQMDDAAQGAINNSGTANITATATGGDLLELGAPGLADPDNSAMRFLGLDEDETLTS